MPYCPHFTVRRLTQARLMRRWALLSALLVTGLCACAESSDEPQVSASGAGGNGMGDGGAVMSGGASATGGVVTVGGASSGGNAVGAGGTVGAGGSVGSGGASNGGAMGGALGGSSGDGYGGLPSSGGSPSNGGAMGGALGGSSGDGYGGAVGGALGGSSGDGYGGAMGGTPGGDAGTSGATAGTTDGGAETGEGGTGEGGSAGSGTARTEGPCDIYAAAETPCVAAHSTVRALYREYTGSLYQLRRASDQQTTDVPVGPEGFADIAVQDSFCDGAQCTISIIYDQSPNGNHLPKSPKALWLPDGGNESNAAEGEITVGGHTVHGIYVTGYSTDIGYRATQTVGIAKGDEPESMYMVVDGKRYSDQCCFDYGNATPSGGADGNGTMEAIYFGNDITWGGRGEGNGPWVAADLEFGVYKSDQGGWQSEEVYTASAKSIIADFATAMLKGPSGNHFTLKAGSAQSGTLTTMWDGPRPSASGYSPKRLEGAIILGTGGDGSNGGTGTFFEGAMVTGVPPDTVDEAVQANIVAAGYGR